MKHWQIVLLIFGTNIVWSQHPDADPNTPVYIVGTDTLTDSKIHLKEVILFKPLSFSSYNERFLYYRLQRKTLKVYPLCQVSSRATEILE